MSNPNDDRHPWVLFEEWLKREGRAIPISHTRDLIRSAYVAGYEEASGAWLPISSAPRDGSAILLLSAAYEMDGGPNGILQIPAKVAIGTWKPDGTSWVDETGRLGGKAYTLAETGVWLSGGGWFQPNEVTHWQPLPPANTKTGQAGEAGEEG